MSGPTTVEYYLLTAAGGFMKFEWDGPDPSFVMLAPLEEALGDLGAFEADAAAVWPADVGTPYFLISAESCAGTADVFSCTPWSDYLTPGRIAATLGVSAEHAAELVDLALAESERITDLLRVAAGHDAGLLCIVY